MSPLPDIYHGARRAFENKRPTDRILLCMTRLRPIEKAAIYKGLLFEADAIPEQFDDTPLSVGTLNPNFNLCIRLVYNREQAEIAAKLMSQVKSVAASCKGELCRENPRVQSEYHGNKMHDVAVFRFVSDTAHIGRG